MIVKQTMSRGVAQGKRILILLQRENQGFSDPMVKMIYGFSQ